MNHSIMQELGKRLVYLDGGMGTLLQGMGLMGGERPETWNLAHPERVQRIHAEYLAAGCDIVTTNTFGAARAHLGNQAEPCMRAGVRLAREAVREAGHGSVAADMGSLGRLLQPYGDMPFEEAVSQFREAFAAGVEEGADLLLIETMTDLMEVKACVLGAKEAMAAAGKELPLWVSLTFDERGRLLTGAGIEGTVAMLRGLRVDAIGLNCGHEPKALLPNVRELLRCCPLPVFVSPNASLPVICDGATVYPTTPEEFGADMREIAVLGAWGLGGCCGTTPEHIRALLRATAGLRPAAREVAARCVISGRSSSLCVGERPLVIGERLNPTGKKRMKQALRENDMDYLLREAIAQCDAGADVLDVNVGLPEIDEREMLATAVAAVQTVCDAPLQIDTADPAALEAALRVYAGKPIINSVCGKQAVLDKVLPLAAKYGGALVALTLDEDGIPETPEGRVAIARRIIAEAEKYGLVKEELLFDALTLTTATNPQAARVTLDTVRMLKRELGVHTVLGVSNVSFGLPQRPLLTGAFLAMAVEAGLDAAIMNPCDATARTLFDAACAVSGKDLGLERYLAEYGGDRVVGVAMEHGSANASAAAAGADAGTAMASGGENHAACVTGRLSIAIERGLAGDAAQAATALLDGGVEPLVLIEQGVMPALSAVGERYEKGTLFLPQLLQSANAAQAAFELIRARMPAREGDGGRKIVLATVHGDVHDIGKNIVKVLLQNYGFTVIDLGKDVPPQRVLAAAREQAVRLVGLSALMTTTVPAMGETIALLHRELPEVKVIVGGAVLTQAYARTLGADGYAKDAMASVRLAEQFLAQ
ncbi:MAG: homocysteine S-methyltransferase family protein [Clostridia bacterium]